MLWSIPVLTYAILYFPELKHLVIGQVLPNNNGESIDFGSDLPFEYLLAMVAAATLALMLGLLGGVSWPLCLMLMLGSATLIGEVAFTLLQMHGLGLLQERVP